MLTDMTLRLGKMVKDVSSSIVKWRHFHFAQQVNVGNQLRVDSLKESESKEDGINHISIGNLTATDARKFGACGSNGGKARNSKVEIHVYCSRCEERQEETI